ncbi:MAG: folate-binding protein YgfZ [Xanthomonadales bacterium]|nr:folate-binding protein YgfZ [Xanthomonadales bacterium]
MMTPGFAEISIEGVDARAFLHAQLASDLRTLAVGSWQFSCYCGVDGRVQALALLTCADEQRFSLLLPQDLADSVLARLQRFRLRSRCALALHALAIEPWAGSGRRVHGCGMDWRIRRDETASPLSQSLWDAQLTLGIPWLLAATSERWLPQMLTLDRLGAYSLRKGCYPGQEIVARTHYLGRSKRRLMRLRVEAPGECPAIGVELLDEDGSAAGNLLAIGSDGHGLAVLAERAIEGARLSCGRMLMVIGSEVSGSPGDAALNEYAPGGSAHGVSDSKVV